MHKEGYGSLYKQRTGTVHQVTVRVRMRWFQCCAHVHACGRMAWRFCGAKIATGSYSSTNSR
jgi:hypothetical protein